MAHAKRSSPQDHDLALDSVRYSTMECDAARYSPEGCDANDAAKTFNFTRSNHHHYKTDASDAVRYPKETSYVVRYPKEVSDAVSYYKHIDSAICATYNCDECGDVPIALPEYCYYVPRLQTFRGKWPKYLRGPTPEEFARAGFVYRGEGDKVQCFSCGVKLHQWEPLDSAYKEHVQWSPRCQYLKLVGPDGRQNS